jgi:hypothetical protein
LSTLHLGVLVQPYRSDTYIDRSGKKQRKSKAWAANSKAAGAITTGDVAEILESKYGIMETFFNIHGEDIGEAAAESLGNSLEAYYMGQVVDPWGEMTGAIESKFRRFIGSQEVERVGIEGTPTLAALMGVNHRLKHPYASGNPRRPSFRDTGLYVDSFKSWVD